MLLDSLNRINWINCKMPYHNFNHRELQPSRIGCITTYVLITQEDHSVVWPWFSDKSMTKTDFIPCQILSSHALLSHQSPQAPVQWPVSCFQENNLKTIGSFSIQWEESKINLFGHEDVGNAFQGMAWKGEKQRVKKGGTFGGIQSRSG